ERFTATKLMVGQYLLATEGMVVFISVLCFIMGIVLFGFFGWHLYLVKAGTTTNELSKWSYLKMCLKHAGALFVSSGGDWRPQLGRGG
ncbi:unnamed protein product, partial [Effrenium voratum]